MQKEVDLYREPSLVGFRGSALIMVLFVEKQLVKIERVYKSNYVGVYTLIYGILNVCYKIVLFAGFLH